MKNAVTANFKDTIMLIKITPSAHPILLCGDHGLGKSACVKQAGDQLGLPVNDVRLAGKEVGDIIGLMDFFTDKKGNKMAKHCPPVWWADYFNPDFKGILFLDEINRAHRDVRQGLFQLILDREMNGYKLPAGVKIVAAINDGEDYDTETLDVAFRSRWKIINFKPSPKEWLDSKVLNLHPLVSGFIRDKQNLLETDKKEVDTVAPDRRAWHQLSIALHELDNNNNELKDNDFRALCGMYIGLQIATVFTEYRKNSVMVTGEKVLKNFDKFDRYINYTDVGYLTKIGEEIVEIMKKKNAFVEDVNSTEIKNLVSFLKKCPMESMRTIYDQCGKANLKFLTTMLKVQKSDKEFSELLRKSITRIENVNN